MDVINLQNSIIEKPECIETVLEQLGFSHIKDKGTYYAFPNIDGDNLGACNVYKDTLIYQNYTRNKTGNLFTLTMDIRHSYFTEAIRWIAKLLNIKAPDIKIVLPFHGFYKGISHDNNVYAENQHKYKESDLPDVCSLSEMFLKDGISLLTQEEWGVRYSHQDDSVLIPVHSLSGDLVGCKARNNNKNCDYNHRWYAFLPFIKSYNVYGLYENYRSIVEKSIIIIFESEKSVLQCASFGLHVAVAIGGHNISKTQIRLIKSMMCKKVIIAFDQDLPEELLQSECQKLMMNNGIFHNKVGYIIDENGMLLPIGSKDSPSDRGKKIFQTLLKNNIKYLN